LSPRAAALIGLGVALLAIGPVAARVPAGASPDAGAQDVAPLQAALAAEEKTEALYMLAVGSGRLRSSYPMLSSFGQAHSADRKTLAAAIAQRGATPVSPRAIQDYVDDLHGKKAASEQDEVDLVRGLERSTADTYARLGPALHDPNLRAQLARMAAADEAHWRALTHAIL
jgi:hypothetical protein